MSFSKNCKNVNKIINKLFKLQLSFIAVTRTVKPVYNDHPWDRKMVAVVDRWSLFRGHLCNKSTKRVLKMMVITDRWSLFRGGCYLRFDCISLTTIDISHYLSQVNQITWVIPFVNRDLVWICTKKLLINQLPWPILWSRIFSQAGNELGANSFSARNELSMLFPYTSFPAGNELVSKLTKNTASEAIGWD